jgi:membrane-bound lytic murein transglycosylase A
MLFFAGCEQRIIEKKENISNAYLEKIAFEDIKNFTNDNLNFALEVFQKACQAKRVHNSLKDVCKKSDQITHGEAFFTQYFEAFKLLNKDKKEKGLITGYYEPILKGSLTKSDKYPYAIHGLPDDLIVVNLSSVYPQLKQYRLRGKLKNNTLVPYETRKEFEQKKDKNIKVICYVSSKIDRFILEIQGSGKVQLEDGTIINVAYAGQNGRPYYAIGKKLIEIGAIKKEDMSMQNIRKWCKENPEKVDQLFYLNESKVFFRKSVKSATGSLGVPLVAKRNIAVDKRFIPLGFPVFINTTDPITNKNIDQLMVAADTGGAIKGDIRADFFWGNGEKAKQKAGKMAQDGSLIILIPKEEKIKKWSNDTSKYLKVKDN